MKKRVCTILHKRLYTFLEEQVTLRNRVDEISLLRPDPLLIASSKPDEYRALVCALYAYGNVNAIVRFLLSLDFTSLDDDEEKIVQTLANSYYRFQSALDTQAFFITLSRVKKQTTLEALFLQGYQKKCDVMDGLKELIEALYDAHSYRSKGYEFLLGKIPNKPYNSPYKRWHMYLRWMVRKDCLDLGLRQGVSCSDLLMPLDVHTFRVGKKLGLITQKAYNFKAVLELTDQLKKLDEHDPIKYDFALYRLGQEKKV